MEKELELFAQAAEQLEELKGELQQQRNASDRIRTLADTLSKVVDQIGLLPTGLQAIVERAQQTENSILDASLHVQELRESVPSIIDSLKKSDHGLIASQLQGEIEQARIELRRIREVSSEIQTAANTFSVCTDRTVQEFGERFLKILDVQLRTASDLNDLRNQTGMKLQSLAEAVQALSVKTDSGAASTATSYTQVTNALRANAEKVGGVLQQLFSTIEDLRKSDVAALSNQITVLQTKLEEQDKKLDAISYRKKGLFG